MEDLKDIESTNIELGEQNPWPGLRAFSEINSSFFFGREQETSDIARMVRQETLTVLFGKSGLGKSSILQAGVSPELRKDNFLPVYIRLNHHEETLPLEDQVEVFLEEAITVNNIDAPKPIREETLWEYFHKKSNEWWSAENHLLKPVLIFDQFEEILTNGQENSVRAARCVSFLAELEDLIENRPPEKLLEKFKLEKGLARQYEFERTDYRILISLREDYLADLEGLRERLRLIMFNRYRLLPMSSNQAINVILKPGGHLVNEEVAHKIIDFITIAQSSSRSGLTEHKKSSLTIEPTLLSVILRELNNQRLKAGLENITLELVAKNHPEHILSEFYESALKGLDLNVRRFIEEQLLTASGARNRIAEEDAIARHGISKNVISKLIDRRIIQRDKISQVTWLELSHDTLTPVVNRHARIHRKKIKIKRRILQASAAVLLVVIVGVTALKKQRDERELQVSRASKMTLELASLLEKNSTMSMSGKKEVMSRLQENFDELRDVALDSELLKLRNAQFLVVNANMQFKSGYYQRAHESVLKAEKLLFDSTANDDAQNNAMLMTKVQIKISKAKSILYNSDYDQVHKELGLAMAIFLQLQSNSLVNKIELQKIEQEIQHILIRTSIAEYKYVRAFDLLRTRQSEIRKLLAAPPNGTTDSYKRHLYKNLLDLNMYEYKIVDFGFYDKSELYSKFRVDLEQALPLFKDDDRQYWQVFDAKSYWLKADMHKDKLETAETIASYDRAIELLTNLIKRSPDNLNYRYDLGRSVLKRSGYSAKRDLVQAKHDIKTARALSYTLRRESQHPYMAYILAALADINELRLNSIKMKGSMDESFDRTTSRSKNYHRKIRSKPFFFDMKIFAYYWKIRGNIKRAKTSSHSRKRDKNKKKISGVMSSINSLQEVKDDFASALAIMDKLETRGADSVYLANRRYYIYQSITNDSKIVALLGDDLWDTYLLASIKQLEILESNIPNNTTWSTNKIWPLTQLAKSYQKQGRETEASKAYHKLVQLGIRHSKLNTFDKASLNNSIWGIRRLIEMNRDRQNWQGVSDSAELLFQLFESDNKNQKIRYPSEVLRYWKSGHEALKKAVTNLENLIHEGKKENGDSVNIRNNFNSNLLEFEKLLRQQLVRSAFAMEQLEEIKISQSKEFVLKYKNSKMDANYDIKSLDMPNSVVVNKGITSSEMALGWKTDTVYKVPGSYTLSGEQVEKYSKNIRKNIIRIRVAKLNFYENTQLLTIESRDNFTIESNDNDDSTQINYFLESKDKGLFLELTGTSSNIHRANRELKMTLNTAAKVVAYLRFFTTFVQGEEGSFNLVETIDEIPWRQDVPQEEKNKVANLLRPVFVWAAEDDSGNSYVTGTISYSNALFHSKFKIHNTGRVEMLEDKPVASNLRVDQFNIGTKNGRLKRRIIYSDLELTKDINIDGIHSEISQLYKLLGGKKIKNTQHRASIFNEIISLSEARNEIRSIVKLLSFLHKEPKIVQEKSKVLVEHVIGTLIKGEIENITNLKKRTPLPKFTLINKYLGLSFYQLFASDFNGALESSKKGLKLDKNHLPLHTNFAHALLFLNRTKEAMDIYYKHMGKKYGDKIWEDIILDDFDQLSEAGITHPDMEIIRKEFSKEKTAELATPADE